MSLRDNYNPEYYYKKSSDLLDTISREEAEAWFNHPCTKSLIQVLEGDFAGILLMWVGGAYSNEEHVATTAQLQAKARGQAQAIDDVIERIYELRDIRDKEEEYETGN